MANLAPLGKDIKKRLIDLDKPQKWLIEEVHKTTGLYFDSSYLHKIQTGQIATPKIVQAITEILRLNPTKGGYDEHP